MNKETDRTLSYLHPYIVIGDEGWGECIVFLTVDIREGCGGPERRSLFLSWPRWKLLILHHHLRLKCLASSTYFPLWLQLLCMSIVLWKVYVQYLHSLFYNWKGGEISLKKMIMLLMWYCLVWCENEGSIYHSLFYNWMWRKYIHWKKVCC